MVEIDTLGKFVEGSLPTDRESENKFRGRCCCELVMGVYSYLMLDFNRM